eukprot:2594485-Rhodomonas_salina.2
MSRTSIIVAGQRILFRAQQSLHTAAAQVNTLSSASMPASVTNVSQADVKEAMRDPNLLRQPLEAEVETGAQQPEVQQVGPPAAAEAPETTDWANIIPMKDPEELKAMVRAFNEERSS